MANTVNRNHPIEWVLRAGRSQGLDPTLATFRELHDVGSELSTREAELARDALDDFLTAADQINPLYELHGELTTKPARWVFEAEAKTLRALVHAAMTLEQIRPPSSDETRIDPAAVELAEPPWADHVNALTSEGGATKSATSGGEGRE